MATWPSTLPEFETPGYGDAQQSNVLRSQMGYGPDKLRARTSVFIRKINGKVQIDQPLTLTLDSFYEANKALTFQKTDPRTKQVLNYRFTSPPAYANMGGDEWMASFGVEIIPGAGTLPASDPVVLSNSNTVLVNGENVITSGVGDKTPTEIYADSPATLPLTGDEILIGDQ